MRSSVPLGALGGGSLELRADGALRDWRMLNNHPAAVSPQGMKQSFEMAALGLWVGEPRNGAGRLLRTQLPAATSGSCAAVTIASGSGLSRIPVGADMMQLALNSTTACSEACCALRGCNAFLFETITDADMGSCTPGKACCFLKSALHKTVTKTLRGVVIIGNVSRSLQPFPPVQPNGIARVAALRYSGAFPVSRLDILDKPLLAASGGELSASLYAFSRFKMHDADATAAPAITFATVLRNPTSQPVRASVLFTMPDVLAGGAWAAEDTGADTLRLTKAGATATSGEFLVRGFASDAVMNTSWLAGDSLSDIWTAFEKGGGEFSGPAPASGGGGKQGALAVTVVVPAGQNVTAGVVLAWHLPHRNFDGQQVGQYYTNLFKDADAVASDAVTRMASSLSAVLSWNRWCMGTSIEHGLKDLLVNSPATFLKTGLWLADGRWRQYESYSCNQVRKMRSWPRSWANFSLLQLYSHRRKTWANLHRLGQPDTFVAPDGECAPARATGADDVRPGLAAARPFRTESLQFDAEF
jgi:uncharacterized protein (DUF608 family)